MTSLYLALLLLLILAAAIFAWGFRNRTPAELAETDQAQSLFYRQRKAEIARDFEQGLIDAGQRQDLELELDRQVLEETVDNTKRPGTGTDFRLWVFWRQGEVGGAAGRRSG